MMDPIALYQERSRTKRCYIPWKQASLGAHVIDVANILAERPPALSRLRIAHGLLLFGYLGNSDELRCVPWHVAPRAERSSERLGRHTVVAKEFNDRITQQKLRYSRSRTFSEAVGTYAYRQGSAVRCIIPDYETVYYKDETRREVATHKIAALSAQLIDITFCLEGEDRLWTMVADGRVAQHQAA